ncbi:MAG TPA: LLM class F420-dependent oxidoreductase, partial [Chloroflexi bacterium]|nr:LLM class F420-dependent oxidoreductase [Chloroflexota bacterium]
MTTGRPQFGIDTAQHQQTWAQLLEHVRFAEDAGFDGIWLFDHFKALYGDPNGPCLEAWTLLAALAAATTRIRLGPMVTGMTYRHPSMLAMEAVTVDHVSGGRVELAVGAAWFEQEHRELGF